jgi:hypothetical protein
MFPAYSIFKNNFYYIVIQNNILQVNKNEKPRCLRWVCSNFNWFLFVCLHQKNSGEVIVFDTDLKKIASKKFSSPVHLINPVESFYAIALDNKIEILDQKLETMSS